MLLDGTDGMLAIPSARPALRADRCRRSDLPCAVCQVGYRCVLLQGMGEAVPVVALSDVSSRMACIHPSKWLTVEPRTVLLCSCHLPGSRISAGQMLCHAWWLRCLYLSITVGEALGALAILLGSQARSSALSGPKLTEFATALETDPDPDNSISGGFGGK